MSASVSVSYVYYLQAFEEGKFEISPATLTIKGKDYKTNKLSVEVIKGNATNQQRAKGSTNSGKTTNTKDDVFLRATISNPNPYQGEQIIIKYKLYTANIGISEIDFQKLASFPGFWVTNLADPKARIQQKEEIINGRQFQTGVLFNGALFPQKSGEIIISPKELACIAQIRTEGNKKARDPYFDSFFDDPFFNNRFQNVKLEMESNALKINVKALPIEGKPAGFSGAVGKFKLESSIDNTEITVNDAITLKLVISGSGNLELINTPEVNWPPDFETYEPKIVKNITTSGYGVSGSRTFEFLAIPRSAGDFTVGPIELSYFDPANKSYKTLKTDAYTINVEKGAQSATSLTYSGVAQEDIMYLGQDIHYIKSGTFPLSIKGNYLFASPLFYAILAAPIFILLISIMLVVQTRKKKQNVALVRNRKATRVAKKNLKKAKEFLNAQQREEFYTEVSRALWGYLSDKFNIPLSDLSMDTVSERLADKDVSSESIDKFSEVLNSCEFARFAPGESSDLMNEIYNESIMLISQIEGELKS